jgi:hypothetical protein
MNTRNSGIYVILFLFALHCSGMDGHAQMKIEKARPLVYAIRMFQVLSPRPILTYEDPPELTWSGDRESTSNAAGGLRWIPKEYTFTLPRELDVEQNPELNLGLLNKLLDAYHSQTDGPRFKIVSSRWGLHIVPAQIRDESGRRVPSVSILDTRVTVPVEKRTYRGHLNAICKAVSDSSIDGMKLASNIPPWWDEYFAPEDKKLGTFPSKQELEDISFNWGTSDSIARDAIIDVLEYSSTSMSWLLLCEPVEKLCVFNMIPISVPIVGPDGKIIKTDLSHDREGIRKRYH